MKVEYIIDVSQDGFHGESGYYDGVRVHFNTD